MSQEKKNQHFVPQCHLRGFAIEDKKNLIWEYDKKYIKISKTPKSIPKSVCCKDYYYEQVKPDGSKTQILEDALNKVETPAIETIRKLHDQKILTPKGKGTLAYYIALLLVRGPSFRDGCHSLLKDAVDMALQILYKKGKIPEPPAEIVPNAEIFSHASLPQMMKPTNEIWQSLCYKKWDIYFSRDDYFVTSDTPVMFGGSFDVSYGVGLSHPQSLIICPLTKNMNVVARPYVSSDDGAYECKSAERKMVEKINQLMCFKSQRFIYASKKSEHLLEYIKSATGFSQSLKAYKFGNAVISRWDTDKT